MTTLRLGKDNYEIDCHRDEDLKHCKMLRLNQNFMERIRERMERLVKVLR